MSRWLCLGTHCWCPEERLHLLRQDAHDLLIHHLIPVKGMARGLPGLAQPQVVRVQFARKDLPHCRNCCPGMLDTGGEQLHLLQGCEESPGFGDSLSSPCGPCFHPSHSVLVLQPELCWVVGVLLFILGKKYVCFPFICQMLLTHVLLGRI